MSIVKNDTSSSTAMTIMKLEKVVNNQGKLASPPLPSGHPLIGFATKYYLELNNYSFQLDFYSRAGETVIIRAMIDPDAEGFIYGFYDGNSVRYIRAYDGKLQWFEKNDSSGDATTPILEREIDGKIHNFGYQGYDDNGTLKCKPYYDKENITVGASTVSYTTAKALLFKQNGQSNVLHSTNTWAIRLYEVAACSFPDSADTAQYQFHYYAAMSNDTTPVKCLMETRHVLAKVTATAGSSVTGVTNRQEIGDFPSKGYGVQLHDLKDITGSGFSDLLAILCEDDGVDGRLGWKNTTAKSPCVLSKSGETNRNFAINLGSSQNHIPIPSGWTLTPPSSGSFAKGELISGRKLKWDIWNDAVKFGKYGSGNTGQLTTMKFNLFKENNGDDVTHFELSKFEGYNQSNSFPPSFDWSGVVEMEFHNGVQCKIDTSNIIVGALYSEPEVSIYYPNFATGGDLGFVKLGNLPLWNYSTAEQDADLKLDKLRSYGGGLIIKADDYSNPQGYSRVGTLFGTTDETYVNPQGHTVARPLSSDSNDTTKLLKTQGIDCSGYFRRDSTTEFWRKRLINVGVNALKMDMCLIKTTGDDPVDADIIDCSQMIASKDGVLKGLFDVGSKRSLRPQYTGKHYHVEDRFLLGEENGVANINGTLYPIGVQLQDGSEYDWCETMISQNTPSGAIPDCGFAIGFGFALKNGNDYLSLFTNDNPNVFGYAQVFEETKTKVNDDQSIVVTQKTIEIEEPEDTYTYDQYSLIKNGQLRDYDVRGDLDDFIETVDAETGNVIFETSFVIQGASYPNYNSKSGTVAINMMSYTNKIQQTTLYYDYEVTGNTDDITCTITITFSREDNGTKSKVTIDHCFYDCRDEEHEVHSTTITDRSISNRSYGFAKTVWNQYTSPHTDYLVPFAYYSWGWFQTSNVKPWNTSADRSQGKMGALFFMWQDLYTRAVAQNVRCNDVKRNDVPMTVWVRLFGTSSGPHAWDLYTGEDSAKEFDTVDECQKFTIDGHTYKFLTNDRLIENENHDFLDTYISVWDSSSQITAASEWEGKTLRLYAVPLHEPKDGDASSYTRHWVAATESVDGHWEYDPIAEFTWDSTATSAGYVDSEVGARCEIKSNLTVYDYLSLGGHPQFEATGIYRLRIYPHLVSGQMLSNPSPGTMYYLSMY